MLARARCTIAAAVTATGLAAAWLVTTTPAHADADVAAAAPPPPSPPPPPPVPPPPRLLERTHFACFSGRDGAPTTLAAVAAAFAGADVVLLGEVHDDAVAHALQLELLRRAAAACGGGDDNDGNDANNDTNDTGGIGVEQQQQQHSKQQPRRRPRPLVLSLEQLERDVQPVVDEWLSGCITTEDLLRDGRPWPNHRRDYQPLMDLAKASGAARVVAANAPRRYVSLAARGGRRAVEAALPPESPARRRWLPPLPWAGPSPALAAKLAAEGLAPPPAAAAAAEREAAGSKEAASAAAASAAAAGPSTEGGGADAAGGGGGGGACPFSGMSRRRSDFLAAQSLWDATMAWSIAEALSAGGGGDRQQAQQQQGQQGPGQPPRQTPLVVHISGKFHCEGRLGIPEHLQAYTQAAGQPPPRVLVVVFVPSEGVTPTREEFEKAGGLVGAGDFVVLTDARLPRSFNVRHPA